MNLNFSNIEELIFYDRTAQGLLPVELFSLFEQWRLAQKIPALRGLGKQAVLDVLNALTEEHILSLEEYFGEKITLEKLNYSVVKNLSLPLEEIDLCQELCELEGFDYFSTWRDEEKVYISFWR